MAKPSLSVQVCHGSSTAQHLVSLSVVDGTTLAQAVHAAFPELDVSQHRVGIFGKLSTVDTVLREYDRVEIYRPLQADPKESRRRRAVKKS